MSLRSTIKTTRNWGLALFLLPIVFISAKLLFEMIGDLGREGWRAWVLYVSGGLIYFVIERWIHKPMWFYVVGHELTHAMSGLMSGAKVHSFRASSRGGEVELSKSNFFVALSPYIVPFYLIVVFIIYAIVKQFWPDPRGGVVFQILVGFTTAFHLSLTFNSFHHKQPDLKLLGLFLSGTVIVLGNLLILGILGISLFKSTPTLKQYFLALGHETILMWTTGVKWIQ